MKNKYLLVLFLAFFSISLYAQNFDQTHSLWTELLQKNIKLINNKSTSQVDYQGFKNAQAQLTAYTKSLSAVSREDFNSFSKNAQLAFLINAYNAFTVELILNKYPNLSSIKDLGGIFQSPWKKKDFQLFGKETSLDEIEHETIRKTGVYDDPRIHFAVNCASIGCPLLREEAYIENRLDSQLNEQAQRFLTDKTRNRFNHEKNQFEISKIFSWYKEDFQKGYKKINSLEDFLANNAYLFSSSPQIQAQIKEKKFLIDFLEYDWKLNSKK